MNKFRQTFDTFFSKIKLSACQRKRFDEKVLTFGYNWIAETNDIDATI